MEENRNEKIDGEVKLSSPFLTKLENFWYHYKWHSIAAVAVVLIIAVIASQFARQVDYDIYVMYAGGEAISHRSENGDIPEYNKYVNALKAHADDYDGDGSVSLALSDLFIMSPEEKAEFGPDADYTSMSSDIKTLNDRMTYSEYYVFFVSKYVYEEYHLRSDTEMFAPITRYCPENNDFKFESDRAVYLSSTDLYTLPVFCDMPEDTLICIRINSEISSRFGKKKNAILYERAQEYITSLLAYEAK